LVASNLGGFSTKWGDTPNIREAEVWHLNALDFTREVLPANLVVMVILTIVVAHLTQKLLAIQVAKGIHYDSIATAFKAAGFRREQVDVPVDHRLLWVGMLTLGAFVSLQFVAEDKALIAIGALTIFVAVMLERSEDRFHTLQSLGFEVYMVFAAIFALAVCVEQSWIGETLQDMIERSGAAPWAITVTGYLGTTFTEAASWVSAAATRIHPLDQSHTAAWALGAGICAGSSSIVTAASAGIILSTESRRFGPDHEISFRRYLAFGLPFSLFMLLFYSVYFSVLRY
jgi:Na+/H+ antiporter NhaD/arsenite permease-like protein